MLILPLPHTHLAHSHPPNTIPNSRECWKKREEQTKEIISKRIEIPQIQQRLQKLKLSNDGAKVYS